MGFGGIVAEVGGIPPLFGGINLKIGGITLWVGGIHPHSSKLTTQKKSHPTRIHGVGSIFTPSFFDKLEIYSNKLVR
ncbi:hypothetical protein [Neobacillus drentensis]|uniref:hypothetical protein n=1 Tax=Neobacillus drentensis TaxID=220684 RepID=UPI002FFF2962